MSTLRFKPGYNKIVASVKKVEPRGSKIILPESQSIHPINYYDLHPKQVVIVLIGDLSEQHEGSYKPGDQVLLRTGSMIEPMVLQGKIYALINPSDILGITTHHEDLKLEEDKDFYNKMGQK